MFISRELQLPLARAASRQIAPDHNPIVQYSERTHLALASILHHGRNCRQGVAAQPALAAPVGRQRPVRLPLEDEGRERGGRQRVGWWAEEEAARLRDGERPDARPEPPNAAAGP